MLEVIRAPVALIGILMILSISSYIIYSGVEDEDSESIISETKSDSDGKGFSAKLWSIDLTGYNERLIETETDGSDPSWSSLLSK